MPELQDPHVLAILRPWVNVGRVGTQVLSRLERHFGSQGLGRVGQARAVPRLHPVSSPVPHGCQARREMTIPNSTISYARREEGPDFLFFNMREPHAFGEDYVDSVLEILKTFGVKAVLPHRRDVRHCAPHKAFAGLRCHRRSAGIGGSAEGQRTGKQLPGSYQCNLSDYPGVPEAGD